MQQQIEGVYAVLPQEAFYVFRTGGQVWASEVNGQKVLMESPAEGEPPRVKWVMELDRLINLGVVEPIQFWVL